MSSGGLDSHRSAASRAVAVAAPRPRRPHMLRPLRLEFEPAQAGAARPASAEPPGPGSAAPAPPGAARRRARSCSGSPSDWMDQVEAQLSSRGRGRGTLSSIGGGRSSGSAAAAATGGEPAELVPPAFVCLGRLGGRWE
jgi:hypothetical protein